MSAALHCVSGTHGFEPLCTASRVGGMWCAYSSTGQSASHLLSDGVESEESDIGRVMLEARVTILSASQTFLQAWN